ncbi:MAG: hypothetical protein IJB70_02065 [Clostridia bacterium]|nr:hypothetical protein [Clostridia bacterium]
MKKIPALLVAVVFVFSSLCQIVGIAADDTNADIEKETTVLNQLGFIKTIPENMNDTLTRGQFTDILLAIIKGDAISTDGAVITDINEFHDYYPTMARAIKLGLITGPNTRADDAIKCNEAIKMLVCATGYNQYALHKGGWPVGYQAVARDIELLNDVSEVGDVALSWRNAIVLLYNAIGVNVLEPSSIGDDVTYTSIEGRTLLTQYHSIAFAEGIAETVKGKSIENSDSADVGDIIIDGKKYTSEIDGLSDFVGYNVVYYYNTDTNKLCSIYPYNNNVIKIDAESVYDYADRTLYYSVENPGSRIPDSEEIKFTQNTTIMYNDVVIDIFNKAFFLDKQGEFTFVDNDDDGKYDVAMLDVTEDYVVKVADTYSETIYDMYDSSKSVCLSDKDGVDASFVDRYGKEMYLSELLRYDVVSVKRSYDGKKVTAIFSNLEARGTIEEIATTNGKTYLTIRGKKYETTPDFAKYENVKTGQWGVFGVTTTGKIACVNKSLVTEGSFYGYLINAKPTSGLEAEYRFRILSQTGDVVIATAAPKLVVDGVSMKPNEAYDYLGGNKINSQPIVYEVNKDGFISNIDTPTYNESEEFADSLKEMYNCFDVSYDEDGNKTETARVALEWRSGIFGSRIATKGTCVFFRVAPSSDAPDEDFSVINPSSLTLKTYSFKAYKTVNDSPQADVIVLNSGDAVEDTGTTNYIISDISEALDEDGNPATRIKAYLGRNENSYYVKDKAVFADAKWVEASNTDQSLNHEFVPGDIVKFNFDSQGNVSKIELVYDRVKNEFYTSTYYNTAGANAMYRISINEVYQNYSGTLLVHKGPIPEGTEELSFDKLETYNASTFTVLVFDPEDRTSNIRIGSLSDLSDFKTTGKGSTIFLQTVYTGSGTIVVYRNLQ